MERLEAYFRVEFQSNRMIAEVHHTELFNELEEKPAVTIDGWISFLNAKRVTYGIQYQAISHLTEDPFTIDYPITVAKGLPPEKGKDGKVELLVDPHPEMQRDENWNFRDVMRIPSVTEGEKLAKILHPTTGVDGKNVLNQPVKAIPGKHVKLRVGQNVEYRDIDNCYYATTNGQFSKVEHRIQVLQEFHVNDTLSLEQGNLDFVGTIIIRGDVPAGFTVKAAGDVKVFGLVEAATIIAGGSIYIAEGIAGQKKGFLCAGENIQIGYINQAKINVGNDLYVENSILHSECVVNGHVYSQKGNLVGGSLSAGKTIEARDVGTRLNTKTEITLGINKSIRDKEVALLKKKKETELMLDKLNLLGEKLATQTDETSKIRIFKLRHRHSKTVVKQELMEINDELSELNAKIGDLSKTKLIVRNFIYQDVTVAFGKYKRLIESDHHFVQMELINNEIFLEQLYE